MKTVEVFTVNKPLAQVFDYIAVNYFDNHAKFDHEIKEMIWRSRPPIKKGTKGTERRSFAGLPILLDFEVTDFDKNKYFAFKNTSGPFLLERSYSLEPVKKGTKVTFTFDMRPKNFAMVPAFLMMKNKSKKSVRHNISVLQKQLSK